MNLDGLEEISWLSGAGSLALAAATLGLSLHQVAIQTSKRNPRNFLFRRRYNRGVRLHHGGKSEEAESIWIHTAEAGHVLSMHALGVKMLEDGRTKQAVRWLRRASECGHVDSMVLTGRELMQANETEEAEHWLRKAAADGQTDGMNLLGVLLGFDGRFKQAEYWLHKASKAGHEGANDNLTVLRRAEKAYNDEQENNKGK